MNISRRWLEAFLRRPVDAREAASTLGMLGAPVDAIEPLAEHLATFVVGRVLTVEPHPDADKLRVTTVDDGSGTIWTVVCGAPNVEAGKRYPFARLGTVMPGGLVIERRKLRGQPSEGMLCSARELGLGDDHGGLLTLDTDAAPGTPVVEVLGLDDERLVVDVTPNRPDLLGHKGVARELAAAWKLPMRLPAIPDEVELDVPPPDRFGDEAVVGGIRVAITDRNGCGRFLAATIRGVRVGASPAWLRERLEACGLRSINNVVDVTNYVMLELNQPMHAYDAATLRGPAILVRPARAGETLVTLDGTTRTLPEGALLIADAERAIGVAGVMGGLDTEVTDGTTDLLLECAWFAPSRVRAGKRALNLSTDASHRFERGTDRWGAVDAFRRAIRLLVTVAGGTLEAAVDLHPAPTHPPRIFVRRARVAQVLGVELPMLELERCLTAIGCTVVAKPEDDRLAVDVPGWRPDLLAEIDLIEEIARIHGYENLPTDLRGARPGARDDDPAWGAADRVRTGLAALGLSEVMTLPMVATGGEAAPRLLNPLSAEHGLLRDRLLPSLLRQVEANWAAQVGDVRLYEVGTVFARTTAGGRPAEALHAAFVLTGHTRPPHWRDGGSTPTYDLWDARGTFERLVALAHPTARVEVGEGEWIARGPDGTVIGHCGPLDADAPAWASALFGGELQVALEAAPAATYQAVPTFPAVSRDLALLVATDRPVATIVRLLEERGKRAHLEQVGVVDEFRGAGLPAGRRSVAVRLTFRAPDRTLTDADVDQAVGRLLTQLERECDVTLRTA